MKKLIAMLILLIYTMSITFAADDWAYELSSKAREIYMQKKTQIPCEKPPELLKQKKTQDIYIAIRDAGLFQTKSCDVIIQKHATAVVQRRLDNFYETCSVKL